MHCNGERVYEPAEILSNTTNTFPKFVDLSTYSLETFIISKYDTLLPYLGNYKETVLFIHAVVFL